VLPRQVHGPPGSGLKGSHTTEADVVVAVGALEVVVVVVVGAAAQNPASLVDRSPVGGAGPPHATIAPGR
jgi:hypothetical protein